VKEKLFELLETMAFSPGSGYRRLDGHLIRLLATARHFDVPVEASRLHAVLDERALSIDAPSRVRLLVQLDGTLRTEVAPLPATGATPLRVGLATHPVDPRNAFLYHKTTRRDAYEDAVASRPGFDDVLLWNDRGEVTESTIANVAVERDGRLVTPPVACGLLPGVERAALLAEGRLHEEVVRTADLQSGQRLWLFNSVRGLYEAELVR
jgi:para-aminobenzoate synthetase / 4-amino-4-deoxychorismate lyase